jgi:lipopolysaccharide/colanic/teichoic acid biosynthesis glycosyltransferase
MVSGWRYRVASVVGVVAFTLGALTVANYPAVQDGVTTLVPLVDRLEPTVLTNGRLALVGGISMAIVLGTLFPLFKPRPRRILDTVAESLKRLSVAAMALATIGYFDLSSRMPRPTLLVTFGLLGVVVPVWFVAIRRRPGETERAVVVGDDHVQVNSIFDAIDVPVVGYVSPSSPFEAGQKRTERTDGGAADADMHRGGLSRLDDVIVERDPDTAYLAFSETDRAEFFGALEACHEHGVTVKVSREHADTVLTDGEVGSEEFVDVDVEPWDWQDRLTKRLFDVWFAGIGLLVLSPLMLVISVTIKLDDRGPVLYSQDRTAELGDTFEVYKFRTMTPEGEDSQPTDDEGNDRITRVGGFLRRTHLDEIPQLWSILVGDMSVVGPRAVWVDEEFHLEDVAEEWRQRWFVKPGLTGLAQINDAASTEPREKLRYDLEYIRRQSFWFDLKIVVRQVWEVCNGVITYVR